MLTWSFVTLPVVLVAYVIKERKVKLLVVVNCLDCIEQSKKLDDRTVSHFALEEAVELSLVLVELLSLR